MNFFFAIIGPFVKWLFQPRKEKKGIKTYKEILWGHKHDVLIRIIIIDLFFWASLFALQLFFYWLLIARIDVLFTLLLYLIIDHLLNFHMGISSFITQIIFYKKYISIATTEIDHRPCTK